MMDGRIFLARATNVLIFVDATVIRAIIHIRFKQLDRIQVARLYQMPLILTRMGIRESAMI